MCSRSLFCDVGYSVTVLRTINSFEEVIITNKVFVGNLNFETTRGNIEDLFAQAGGVMDVAMPTDRDTGRPRGFAFVEFADETSAMKAIEMFDGYELEGRTLRVNPAENQPQRSHGFKDSGPGGGGYRGSRPSKPKGSRRNIRAQKRGY
ncbi:MAG: hypothetical protein R6U37_09895 [Dehalococcoidia bacterium]